MELVEILARELVEWPEGAASMSQDSDVQVSHYECIDQIWTTDSVGRWNNDGYIPCSRFTTSELATDHATAIVTREMWQAERERIKLEQDMESVGAKLTTSKKGGSGSFKTTVPMGLIGGYSIATNVRLGGIPIADFGGGVHIDDPRHNRDRIRAIDVLMADLTKERAERVAELAAEGFALI